MLFVDIKNNQIYLKMRSDFDQPGLIEIKEDIYNQLTYLPASYTTDEDGKILTVTPAEPPAVEPEPPTNEEYLIDLDYRLSLLELGL
jgi:hypothetical protein